MEFLQVASDLLKHSQAGEGHYRSAVSRQYYALFLLARNKLSIDDDTQDAHRAVIEALQAKSGKAGNYLASLRKERNLADYGGSSRSEWQASARLHQALAESMAKTIQALK